MLLSPDHAVFEQGALIPVRHLLNDATITQVAGDHVTYWHVELAAHDVILAEGWPARATWTPATAAPSACRKGARRKEAWRRRAPAWFRSMPAPPMGLARRRWQEHGCARLLTADAELVPVRRRLREHARIAGWQESGDAALRLLAGAADLQANWDGRVATAEVPAGASVLRLCSRSAVPSRLGDGSTDGRRLGVAVTRILLDGRELRLDDARIRAGWHRMEQGWRWTDGDAAIPLTPMRAARPLEVHTAPMLAYWQAPPAAAEAARQAA